MGSERDIVERCRRLACRSKTCRRCAALREAAAEIERLRKVAEQAKKAVEAGAIDEIYLSLIADALADLEGGKV